MILYLYIPHIHPLIFLHLLDNTPISMPFILDVRNNLCHTNSGSNSGHISSCTALTAPNKARQRVLLCAYDLSSQSVGIHVYCLNFKQSYGSGLFRSTLIFRTYAPMMNNCLDILSLWLLLHVSLCTNLLFVVLVYCLCSDVLVHLPQGR